MKKPLHGASLYYATDKNIFDALNQHKVDSDTVQKLFLRRNIIISNKLPREELAKYFSRLTHDFYDHQDISARLGIATRRERVTSLDIAGNIVSDQFQSAIEKIKKKLESTGDIVQVNRENSNLTIEIQYSTIDYKKSEFTQIQTRDGVIEFVQIDGGFRIRNTQNEYINNIREEILAEIDKDMMQPLEKKPISLFNIISNKLRSKFFHDLISSLPGFVRSDVTDVYVYKAKPKIDEDDDDSLLIDDPDTHIERVFLRGNGVSRSELLNELLDEKDYYIVKVGWIIKETLGTGNVYDVEAVFSDPKDCTGFSYMVNGVFPLEEEKISAKKRSPTKEEINRVTRVIENRARELVKALNEETIQSSSGE